MTDLIVVQRPGDQLARYAAAFLTTWDRVCHFQRSGPPPG